MEETNRRTFLLLIDDVTPAIKLRRRVPDKQLRSAEYEAYFPHALVHTEQVVRLPEQDTDIMRLGLPSNEESRRALLLQSRPWRSVRAKLWTVDVRALQIKS